MIIEYRGIKPKLGAEVFLAPGVVLLGDVEIGDCSNLWFYTVARADANYIRIGARTNIQDHCTLHVTTDRFPLVLGAEVIVGHRAVLHGATIHDRALIGIGALVLDGSVVEEGAIVGAGAVVSPGSVISANKVAMGIPARPVRDCTESEREFHLKNCLKYKEYGRKFSDLTRVIE
ncbi:MAG: gamma carbonic anhydrase family protein [Desulfomonilaceae bacterium]